MKYNFVIFRSEVMSGRQRTHLWQRYIREEWIYIFDSCGYCESSKRGKGIYNFLFRVSYCHVWAWTSRNLRSVFHLIFLCYSHPWFKYTAARSRALSQLQGM